MSMVMLGGLSLASQAPAAVWTGATDNNWETGTNWDTGIEPDANTVLSINALSGGTVVNVNSATAVAKDVSLDSTTADNLTVNIKNGAILTVTPWNFDLGYTGGSTGTVLLNVENGGTLNAGAYFGRARANPNTLIQVAGQINAQLLYQDPGAHLNIDFASTGVMVVTSLLDRQTSEDTFTGDLSDEIQTLIENGHIKVQGVGFGDSGWGVTYGINTSYDTETQKTTITAFSPIPEPVGGVIMLAASIGGLLGRRRR
jgi:hypothetical protein